MKTANYERFEYSQLKGGFFFIILLREARQGVHSFLCLFLIIIYLNMLSAELLGLLDLTRTQTFRIHKTTNVVMINKHENFVLATFYVVLPGFKDFNNSQKLNVPSFVSSFGWNHLT